MNKRLWKRITRIPLFILDDFGFRRYSSEEAELLNAISDERLGRGSTTITSNRPTEERFSVLPDPVIGGAVLDRLASSAQKLIVEKAKSYRNHGPGRLQGLKGNRIVSKNGSGFPRLTEDGTLNSLHNFFIH